MIDTTNKFMVSGQGERIRLMNAIPLVREGLTHDEAVSLAAWLVALAYQASEPFEEVLKRVQQS
jgi:hypothetical protein